MAKQDVELQFKLIDGVSKGLAAIQQGVNGLGASLTKINQAAELTGKAFGAISSVAGAFGDAITGAASVEDALTRVNTITRATVEEQSALQDAVRGAVEGTRFSAEEAAGALVLLAEDGFSASEAVSQLGSVLQFAQANAQSAAQATGALGAVLDTFGEKPAVIGELADTLTAVAIGAGTSTKALQEGLAGVGNAADQAGISLNDTIGYLGLLASRGIEGGAAVGNFNKIIREIEDPASKAGQALATLGLQGADFATVLKRLGSDSAAAETVLSALGRKPREALRVLLQEGGGDLGKFADIIRQSTGASKEASDALNKTFAGALDRVGNQLRQVRNDLLTPILQPLAIELQSFSAQLADFAKTEQFALIVEQFRLFSTAAIEYIGEAVRSFDFAKAVDAVGDFAFRTVELFKNVEQSLKTIAGAVNDTANLIKETYQGLADFAGKVEAIYSDFQNGTTDAFNVAGDGIKRFGEESDRVELKLGKLSGSTKKTSDAADTLAKSTGSAGKAADTAGASLGKMGKAADGASVSLDNVVRDVGLTAEALGGVPSPAGQTASALESVSVSSNLAGQSLNALEKKLSAVREALANAPPGSPAFIQLAKDAAVLEEQIRLAKEPIDEASGANERLAGSSDKAAGSLRNQADAASEAANGADDVSSSSDDASESLSNFEQQTKSVSFSLGTMSEAFARQAQEATLAAKSATEYVQIWNSYVQRFEDIDQQIQKHIDVLRAQNGEMSEEDRIRRLLLVQYGNSSTRIEELVQLKLKQAEATRKANDEAEREIQIEERRTQLAGGIGTQGAATTATGPGASAGRGAPAGASRGDSPINITINQNGATPETIREIAPLIERELGRLGALRR